jgi:hypothetical protein
MRFLCFIYALSAFFTPDAVMAGSGPFGGMDILPTPKMMKVLEKKFALNENRKPAAVIILDSGDRRAALAAGAINDRIKALGGVPLPEVTAAGSSAGRFAGMNVIRLGIAEEGRSGGLPGEVREAMETLSAKGEQGYAIRFCKGDQGGEAAYLAGAGWRGVLHASATFRLLIKREGATIFATEARITDWPDFKIRGVPVWPLPASYADFKRYVDWAFQYKFNRIYTYATRKNGADGFNLPTREERAYLKRINNYAKERGIIINYALTWATAPAAPDGNGDERRGGVLFNDHYYSWGDDNLLRKRAAEIARFAKETDAGSLHFHCIDTYEEGWDKRGENDRARFGNDRASADANVIDIFTEEIRKLNPAIELQFVVYPYHVNFEIPGNELYKTWMKSLTARSPDDVYLIVAELNRDQADSWIATAKQPLVHWINGNAFQWGRYFSTLPAFTGSAYYEGRDRDIVIHMEPVGYFNGEVMQLVAAEYEWNVDGPGSGFIKEDRSARTGVTGANLHFRNEKVNGAELNSWAWYHGTTEPKATTGNLLLKACRLEFGETAAPYMADFFRNNPVGRRSASLFAATLRDVVPGDEADASRDQLNKTINAVSSLKKALSVTEPDGPARDKLTLLLKNTYQQQLAISGMASYYQARQLSMKGLSAEAAQEIKNGRDRLQDIRREMENSSLWSGESVTWYEEGDDRLKLAEAGLNKNRSPNLIKNPGFEERRNSAGSDKRSVPLWTSVGTVQLSRESHSGAAAASLQLKPSDSYVYMEQPFSVAAGCEAYVEFWLKKDGEFRAIPIIQYWNEDHTRKVESVAADDFPFNTAIGEYRRYSGKVRLPPHATQAVFKIYADWFGFTPNREKMLYIDDLFVSCGSNKWP